MLLIMTGFLVYLAPSLSLLWLLVTLLIIAAFPLMLGAAASVGLALIEKIHKRARFLVFAAVAMVYIYFSAPTTGMIIQQMFVVVSFLLVAGSLSNLTGNQWNGLSVSKKVLNVSFLTVGSAGMILMAWFFIYSGPKTDEVPDFASESSFQPDTLQLTDPSLDGPYAVTYFTYGSGTDRHREEFADGASLVSETADGSAFIDGWEGFRGNARTFFWGFGPDSLPLNGRVWMPDGTGSFPLILMVHGNHLDRDYSDEGYAYLGEHFATLGCIAVSVDQNFLNSALTNFTKGFFGENDARGWLLLKHIEQLEKWNHTDTTRFSGKIDLENIILIGHSRGGEAVNIAACFNELPFYPDDAEEKFDFNYSIKGIAAIAQVDGQYEPSSVPTPIRNINYFALQGSYDADMNSYHGLRPLNRLVFDDSLPHFKAGLFIHTANHGQFNTTWGWNDIGYPGGLFLNRRDMLAPGDQRKIASVYLTAFVLTTFGMEPGYRELFRDHRTARHWLPEAVMLNQYADSDYEYLVNYEEDLDLTTTSSGDLSITFENLSKVKEQEIQLRWSSTENKAVILGWNNSEDSIPGYYKMQADTLTPMDLTMYDRLVMTVAAIDEDPGERPGAGEETSDPESDKGTNLAGNDEDSGEQNGSKESGSDMQEEEDGQDEPLDFSVILVDTKGDSAIVHVADVCPVQPPITPRILKSDLFSFHPTSEIIPQFVYLPLDRFSGLDGTFRSDSVLTLQFVFDRTEKGLIMIDDIGFTNQTNR